MLYHFSEEPDILSFVPRPAPSYPHLKPCVFAIDRERQAHYFFPRDCPRIIYWPASWTTEEDKRAFFSDTAAKKIIAVETDWLDRIRNTTLFRYTFPAEGFELMEEAKTAGYYISYEEIKPLYIEPLDDLLGLLAKESDIELRFTPNLHPLRERVLASSLDFSIIRFRNAKLL